MVVSFLPALAHYSKILSTHVLCNHLNQWFPKSGLRPKKSRDGSKTGSRPGDPNFSWVFSTLSTASFSVCSIGTWETSRLPRLTPDLATFWQKSSTQLMTFSIHCLGLRSRGVHQTQIWVALKKVWEWLTLNVQIVLFKTNVGFQVFLQKLQLVKLYPLEIKPTARHSITTNRLIS